MESLMGLLLPFGNITASVVTLIVVALGLAGVYQLGIMLIRLFLALDAPDAPDIKMENKVWRMLSHLVIVKPEDLVLTKEGVWVVYGYDGYYCDTSYAAGDNTVVFNVNERRINQGSKEKALLFAEGVISAGNYLCARWCFNRVLCIFPLLVLDLMIYLVGIAFLPTVTLLCIAIFIYGVRTLAQKVYKNIKRLNTHEDKITTLEGDK